MQTGRIIARIGEKLEQLPKVIKQAHERIIRERQVKNGDRILSAHESDIDMIVRGKAGASVEFGNELLVNDILAQQIELSSTQHHFSSEIQARKLTILKIPVSRTGSIFNALIPNSFSTSHSEIPSIEF